jgi:hypothetical protein
MMKKDIDIAEDVLKDMQCIYVSVAMQYLRKFIADIVLVNEDNFTIDHAISKLQELEALSAELRSDLLKAKAR